MPRNVKVRVKLYARLDRYLPEKRAERNEADLDLPNGTTVAEAFRRLNLPPEMCHLVLVNGRFVAPGERATRALRKGDHLAVWPPVAGGVDAKAPPGAAGAKTKTVITKEMAVTHAEFFRLLPGALEGQPFRKTGHRVVVEEKGKRLDIGLGPERSRQIAGLKLPATDVTLSFTGYDKTEIAAALRLFERTFQKGGG
jgi:sulfur carrier protein ThiS